MRDIYAISEAALQAQTERDQRQMWGAIGVATASGALSLAGMMLRYSPGDQTPLPHMQHFSGQLGWSLTLTATLLLGAWLLRGVIMQRLQWAVSISLLLHLILALCMRGVTLSTPLSAEVIEADNASQLRELTLPDYGGMEETNAETAAWQQPQDTAVPETQMELERQQAELEQPRDPQPVEVERAAEIAKLEIERQQPERRLERDQQIELERQQRELKQPVAQPVEAPKVDAAKAKQLELEAQVEQAKQKMELAKAERKLDATAPSELSVDAAKLDAQRADPRPQVTQTAPSLNRRQAQQATAVTSPEQTVNVAAAAAVNQPEVQERATDSPRRNSANLTATDRSASTAPASSTAMSVSSARPDRASGSAGMTGANAAPSAGGAAALSRTAPAANSGSSGAANAGAESVSVAAAAGANTARVAESSAVRSGTRGSASSLPTSASGLTAPSSVPGTGSSSGSPTRATGTIARSGTGSAQPTLGRAEGTGLGPAGTARQIGTGGGAVGTDAGNVAVASVGGSAASNGNLLGNGPANVGIGRQSTGLPNRASGTSSGPGTGTGSSGSGPGSSTQPGAGSGAGPSGTGSGAGLVTSTRGSGSGLAGRNDGFDARLGSNDGFANGSSSNLPTGRATIGTPLPAGAEAAERIGNLVVAGPQAQPLAGGGLSGPRMSSVPRRSAGLPGSAGGPSGSAVPTGSGASQPTRLTGGPGRIGSGDDRPKLGSETQIAGLIKQAAPGLTGSADTKISAGFALRKTDARRGATESLGGSTQSEEAVERGLVWLVRHQAADGHWGIHELHCKDHNCANHGSFKSDSAATGLALLAFLGAGYTHQTGQHKDTVDRGLKWLVAHQKTDGDLFADESEFVWFYSHGMAAIALCEAYGLTKDPALRGPTQKSLDFIVASQHPEFGGWRYRPKFEADTSVSGWQLMALKSGEMAGLSVPKSAYVGVSKWLDSAESKTVRGQFSYHPSRPTSPAMTAEGLLMRQYLGASRTDSNLIAGAEFLRQRLPDLNERDAYYWYYATQVMFHMQGNYWDDWNSRLRDTLVTTQLKDGEPSGSWNPERPTPDKWGTAGGRHYLTCLNLLMLEVYYRHLPLYIELGK